MVRQSIVAERAWWSRAIHFMVAWRKRKREREREREEIAWTKYTLQGHVPSNLLPLIDPTPIVPTISQ
jgi:hypothetical protein